MVTDLLVRINASAAGYEAALAKAQLSTYKFDTSLRGAQAAVAELEAEMMAAGPRVAAASAAMAEKQAAATLALTKKVGTAFGVMGAAGAIGFGLVAKAAAAFDEKMATVASLVPHTAREMEGLRKVAVTAGQDIAVSGTDAADAEIELAKAGISAADIMGGALRGALLLAAAGQTDVATATTVAASAMTQFGLAGKDVPHIADLLAAGADKSLGSVTDLGYALSQAGTTANQAGISIEETTGVLAEFAAAGLIGERGGTTFKQMLLQLENASGPAAVLMEKYSLSLYDASGQIKTMPELAANLTKSFGDLEPAVRNAALAEIFGTRAVQGANIMMQAGAKTTAEWISKVNDQGFAAQQAGDKLDSLNGDLDRFRAAMSNTMVGMGESSMGPLRELVQTLTGLVAGFNGLPGPVKAGVTATLALAAVIGTLGFVASRAITGLALMKTTVDEAGVSMTKFNTKLVAQRGSALAAGVGFEVLSAKLAGTHQTLSGLSAAAGDAAIGFSVGGPWGAAIGGAIGLLTQFGIQSHSAVVSSQDLTDTLNQQTGAVTQNTLELIAHGIATEGLIDPVHQLGLQAGFVTAAFADQGDNAATLRAKLQDYVDTAAVAGASGTLTDRMASDAEAARKLLTALGDQNGALADARKEHEFLGAAAKGSATATDQSSAAFQRQADAAKAAADEINRLTDAQNKAALAAVQNKRNELALIETYKAARAEAAKGAKTLDVNTQAGRDNWNALLDLADQWDNTKVKVQNADGAYEDMRQKFIATAIQMGANTTKANALADKFLDMPAATIKAAQAVGDMATFITRTLGMIKDEPVKITLSAQASKVEAQLAHFGAVGVAAGGAIRGPGTKTSDSIPALLSAGEHVWTADEVTAAGGHGVMKALRRMAIRHEIRDVQPFAGGGAVDLQPSLTGVGPAVAAEQRVTERMTAAYARALSKMISNYLTHLPVGGMLGPGGTLAPSQLVRGQNFASAQVGKPYVWGGVGPSGYDCSGYQSAILNAALGMFPYSRRGSTGTMPWPGSSPGVGRYTMGWSTNVGGSGIGHTSGNIGGLNVESYGGHGPAVGSGARSPLDSMFYGLMHYDKGGVLRPGYTLAYNGTGADEHVLRLAGGGGVPTVPPAHGGQVTLQDLHHMVQVALSHFGFGPKATASTIKDELHTLVQALRDALGKDSPMVDHIQNLGKRLVEAAKAQDRVSAHLDALRGRMDAYASSVTATFRNDPFGMGAEGLLTQLHADRNDARKMHQALRKAKRRGLDGPLFKALAASGDLETAQQLANMSPAEIHKFEIAYAQRQHATKTLGGYAGQQVYGDAIGGVKKELHHLNKQIRHLEHAINHIGHHVRDGAHRGTRDGMREQGRRAHVGTR